MQLKVEVSRYYYPVMCIFIGIARIVHPKVNQSNWITNTPQSDQGASVNRARLAANQIASLQNYTVVR